MNNNWTREETIIAFNVYCKIPFKDSNKNHPMIIKYANIIGRSPSALNMKVGNLGRLDPKLKEKFSPDQVEQIMDGETPDGKVWHHNVCSGQHTHFRISNAAATVIVRMLRDLHAVTVMHVFAHVLDLACIYMWK